MSRRIGRKNLKEFTTGIENVMGLLEEFSRPLVHRTASVIWNCPNEKIRLDEGDRVMFERVSKWVKAYYKESLKDEKIEIYGHIRCNCYYPLGEERKFKRMVQLKKYDVIHFLTNKVSKMVDDVPDLKLYLHDEEGNVEHYMCLFFASVVTKGEKKWKTFAVCKIFKKQCKRNDKSVHNTYKIEDEYSRCLVELNRFVRRSHRIEATWEVDNDTAINTGGVEPTGSFVLNSRKEGFPPRKG